MRRPAMKATESAIGFVKSVPEPTDPTEDTAEGSGHDSPDAIFGVIERLGRQVKATRTLGSESDRGGHNVASSWARPRISWRLRFINAKCFGDAWRKLAC